MNNDWCNFFSTKYGSTAQYANWIGEATSLSLLMSKMTTSTYQSIILGFCFKFQCQIYISRK